MSPERTSKKFKNTASFSDRILVCCPNCGMRASVLSNIGRYTVPYVYGAKSVFRCNYCFKQINEREWHGPVIVKRVCGFCRSPIEKRISKGSRFQKTITVTCDVCGSKRKYHPKYEYSNADSKQATDPYFGLDLWLQAPVGDNIFWAYNHDHLDYLKTYVSAKLREATQGGRYSLAWKLPNFIKYAKNRGKILKVIEKLEKK